MSSYTNLPLALLPLPHCFASFIAPAGPSPRPESSGGRWMRPGWYSFPHGRLFSYFVGPKFQNKGCWMVIRPLSELRTGIAWARDVPVSGWNWYGTEETTMLKASAPTQMMMVFDPLRRQLCVDAPCKGDHGRVEARERERERNLYFSVVTGTHYGTKTPPGQQPTN